MNKFLIVFFYFNQHIGLIILDFRSDCLHQFSKLDCSFHFKYRQPVLICQLQYFQRDLIDKTACLYQMVKTGSYYFLSRPRRFGKSLLISTLEAYFQGKKELFEGLAMEKLEKDWIRYPVLHLDLNIEKYDTPESLDKILHDNLDAELHEFAEARGVSYDKLCDYLKAYYDGYHFTHHSIGMYNPFSLLNTFKYKEFGSYWFETGTPTYLVKLLKKHHYDLERMAHEETDSQVLNSIDSESTNPIPVLYQSGTSL